MPPPAYSFRPTVFVGDDSPVVQVTLTRLLDVAGVHAYIAGMHSEDDAPTKFIGGFKCAIIALEPARTRDDPVDEAELLRLYQPTLPVAFLHEQASMRLMDRARALGPVFHRSSELEAVAKWALSYARPAGG
jgi:hypothetical protein